MSNRDRWEQGDPHEPSGFVTWGSIISDEVDALLDDVSTLSGNVSTLSDDVDTLSTQVGEVEAGAMGVVAHGTDDQAPRPEGYAAIHWIGDAEPANALDGDLWTQPS